MAVTNSRLRKKEMSLGLEGQRNHTWTYLVKAANDDDPYTVYKGAINASPDPVPDKYEQHPLDSNSFCVSLEFSPVKENEGGYWLAVARWSQPPDGQDPQEEKNAGDNPLLRPTRWQLGTSYETEKVFTHPADNKPILTVNGNVALSGFDYSKAIPTLTAEKNFRFLTDVRRLQSLYMNKNNSTAFAGFSAGEVRCTSIATGGIQRENGIAFYTVHFNFDIDFNNTATSHARIPMLDFIVLKNGDKIQDFDEHGNPIIGPKLVKQNGEAAEENDTDISLDVRFPTANFNNIGLGRFN